MYYGAQYTRWTVPTIQIRISDGALRELDLVASAKGLTRSDVVRGLLAEPTRCGGSMDAEELVRVVSESARAGSVQAMRLRDEMLRRAEADETVRGGPLAELDEIARRRAERGS